MKRRWGWSLLLWLLLPLAFGWMALNLPLEQAWRRLSGLYAWQVAALIGLNLALVMAFSLRWWLLLRGLGYALAWPRLALYRLAAFGISYLTPGPQFGGEPLQVYLLHRKHGVPAASALASVTLDKLLELLTNYLFLLLCLGGLLLGREDGTTLRAAWDEQASLLLPVFLLLLFPALHLFSLARGLRPLSWVARRAVLRLPQWPKLQKMTLILSAAEDQIGDFSRRRWRLLLVVINLSLLVWAAAVVEYWLSFAFLGLRLTFFQLIALTAALRLSLWVPVPGGAGALEAGQMLALNWLGLDPVYGIGVLLLLRVRDFSLAGAGLVLGAWLGKRNEKSPAEGR